MKPASGFADSSTDATAITVPEVRFLVQLEPWGRQFLRNIGDLFDSPGEVQISSAPAEFWTDVFVASGLPWSKFAQSAIYHVTVFALLWATVQLWPQPRMLNQPLFIRDEVISYSPSEYLPPLDTGDRQIQQQEKGEPEYAPQPIISLPPAADNRTQTIVTPPDIKINHDVPLPNVVSWMQMPGPAPLAARAVAEMNLPASPISVVAPPPDVARAMQHQGPSLQQAVVSPPPALQELNTRGLQSPQGAVVAPPPNVDVTAARKFGDINIGHSDVIAPSPRLPMAEQRAVARGAPALGGGGAVVPPPSAVAGTGTSSRGGQLIALSIHPAAINAPVDPPAGNRRGTFSATPQGKHGAPGTPDISPGTGHDGGGSGSGHSASGLPNGLHVGAGPGAQSSSVTSQRGADGAGGGSSQAEQGDGALVANATPPRVSSASPSRPAKEVSASDATDLEKKVFGNRKFYSMTLNMPNLNSSGGSWVIRFAELSNSRDKGDLAAPVALQKVDPAYPLALMRRNVQGTVTLYAIIRSDGSVGQVRVLQGVDDRLDAYARSALTHWRFQPATKNGNAVDLEAVVAIPFRVSRTRSGF